MKYTLLIIALLTTMFGKISGQVFPNPATLSTGQGPANTLDPIWTVSQWYATNPPNPMGLTFTPALINNSCAPGSWVNPATLPPPVNNGNWITAQGSPCATNYNDGYIYFRLTLNLPADCNGNSISTTGSYTLYLTGYVDNTISDVFINGNSTGINGGSFSAGSQLNMTLTGPWLPGINYVDVQVYNLPNGQANPYGLLLVANSVASSNNDIDNDGVNDINDLCPCQAGLPPDGCPPPIDGDTIICLGETTTLTATRNGTYVWSTGSTNASITISPTTTTNYSVTVTGTNGITNTASANVTVNQPPAATISPANPSICIGNNTTLTATGGTSYLWGTSATTPSVTVSPTNTTSYTVTVTDANTCTATATSTVTVNPLPTASINPANAAVCIGSSTSLTASGGTSYLWSTSATTASITVSPTSATSYSVTVTDANTCTATTTSYVSVNPLPTAGINPVSTAICNGNSTTLTASGGISYTWSNSTTNATTTVQPTATTTYSVTVTDANTCTATTTSTVTVNPLPTPSINPVAAICIGNSTTITVNGGTSFAWSNGATTAATTVSPTATNTYTVTVTDANACTASTSSTVTVNPLPIVSVSPSIAQICHGQTANFTGSGGVNYIWSDGTTGANLSVAPLATSNYTVTTTDANGCSATATAQANISVFVTVTTTTTDVSCANGNNGQVLSTPLGGQPPYTYQWNNAANTQAIQGIQAGSYTVTATDIDGCTGTATATVTEPVALSVTATATDATCNGSNDGVITVAANGGTVPYNYAWSDGTAAGMQHNLLAPGNYTVSVVDSHGCTESITETISQPADLVLATSLQNPTCATLPADGNISVAVTGGTSPYGYTWSKGSGDSVLQNLKPGHYLLTVTDNAGCTAQDSIDLAYLYDFSVATAPLDSILMGESDTMSFVVTGNAGNFTPEWTDATTLSCSNCDTTIATPYLTSIYTITITNDSGCTATAFDTVVVTPHYDLFVPNAFTANGDGRNDYFSVYGNLNVIQTFDIKVFNRWGEKVFESANPKFRWDGTYKGDKAPNGIYVYALTVTYLDGYSPYPRKGSVVLLR